MTFMLKTTNLKELPAYDKRQARNCQAITEVSYVLLQNMLANERNHLASVTCLSRQQEITKSHRTTLVAWLIDVHRKFKLSPETIHIAINLIDRFTNLRPVQR